MSRTQLVTGAGSGIGARLVDRLHGRGDEVVLLARSDERAAELAERWPGARTIVADLAAPQTLEAAWPDDLDRLDSLVHSAGVVTLGSVADLSLSAWTEQLTVNLVAVAELTRLALPALRSARGSVVLVNSGAGLSANPSWAAYAASKHGLRALADALRGEEAEHGVRVTSVYPGRTATPMQASVHEQEGAEYDPARFIDPSTVAEAVLHVLDLPLDATISDLTVRPGPR